MSSQPEPLKPWSGDAAPEDAPDEESHAYLWMAGILCGLILAIGAQALLGHFAERPELAQSDPLVVGLIHGARWVGWTLVGASLVLWLRLLTRKPKKD
jgi:hypothetical protein